MIHTTPPSPDRPRTPRVSITRRAVLAAPLLAAVVGLGGCSVPGRGGSDAPADPLGDLVAWPAKDKWPKQLLAMPQATIDNYKAAVPNKALLQWIPCYCGCYANGHTSVYSCYVAEERPDGSIVLDTMSFGWGICNDIARGAITMQQEGKKVSEIRRYIDEHYQSFGIGTDTPMPPEDL